MTTHEEELTVLAQGRHPRCTYWWGIRGGSAKKVAMCYVCDQQIDTWSAKWPMPKHAKAAVAAHRTMHEHSTASTR